MQIIEIYKNTRDQDEKGNFIYKPFFLTEIRGEIKEITKTKILNRGLVKYNEITIITSISFKDYVHAGYYIKLKNDFKQITDISTNNGTVVAKIIEEVK